MRNNEDAATLEPRWRLALTVVAAAQFTVIMDSSIIGVSLPHIQSALGFSDSGLSWVFNAYVLAFGGLLLLGGRLSDLFGARFVFLTGWTILALASLLAGLSWNPTSMIVGRAVQGVGSALIAPAAMSLLMAIFAGTPMLKRAFTVYGAVAPIGGTVGVFLGGLLTEYVDWRWTFYVSIPIAIAVILLSFAALPVLPRRQGSVGIVSAATVTIALGAIVYGLLQAPGAGWRSYETWISLTVGAALLAAFAFSQTHTNQPLLQLSLFRLHPLTAANMAQFLLGAAWVPTWYFLNIYLQNNLDQSALTAGSALSPMIIATALAMTLVVPRLAERLSERALVALGFLVLALAMLWFSFSTQGLGYVEGILLPSLFASLGMALVFVPSLTAAVSVAPATETGIASALVSTSYQIGSALGLATITAVTTAFSPATTHSSGSFAIAFGTAALIALGGSLIGGKFLRGMR
jgi:EmrB/QacA subfamily drug resistance transporter